MAASGLDLLFTLKAKNEAAATIKQVEGQIAQLKARMKEVKAENDVPFKTQKLQALGDSLKTLTAHHKALSTAAKQTAQAYEQDLSGALGTVSPRLASLAAAGGPLTLGAIAAVAMAAGVGLLGKALFGAAQSAAEFQGKMLDLSQQTGVAVETLSTLEVVAATTGGSIEQIAQSLVIFQGKLDEAQDSGSKAAKSFKALAVETFNTEDAFRQTLKALAAMPEGFRQTNEASELFGRRGGKQVLAILKEMDGDLDATTKRFREMGIVISTEDAKAADEFNDQLALVGFQMRAVGAIVGKEVMPAVKRAVDDFSQALKENKPLIDAVAFAASVLASVFANTLRGAIAVISQQFGLLLPVLLLVAAAYERITGAAANFAGVTGGAGAPVKLEVGADISVSKGILRPKGVGGSGSGGGGKTDTRLRDATREADLAERAAFVITDSDIAENKRALDEQVRSIEEFTQRAIALDQEKLDATINRISAESNALEEALSRKKITQAEYENRQRELDVDAAKAHQETKDSAFKLERERDLQISEERIAARQRESEIAEAIDQRDIDRIKNRVDQGVLAEAEGERQIAAIVETGFERRKKLLEEEADAYSTSLERKKDITAELIRLDIERSESAEEAARRIFDAENAAAAGATRPRQVNDPNFDVITELARVTAEQLGLSAQYAQTFGDVISSTFGQVASAVGEAVHAFVLFGTAQGSFKKFAAEVIASVAQMAAVQAIFELAQGLAMLALNFFFPNPKYAASAAAHFQAAAIYGGIAVVAAGVGRAVAGNSFNQSGTDGSGSGGSSGTSTSRSEPAVTDIDRRGTSQPIVNLTIRGDAAEGFTYLVENAAVKSARSNGVFRKIQNGEDV